VINNALFPEFKVTSNNTFAIGGRGLDTMIKSQTRGSLDATYAFTKRAGIGTLLERFVREDRGCFPDLA
jgi:hypothetical protein